MHHKAIGSQQTLNLIASKWVIPVLSVLSFGVKRYSEIDKSIPEIKQKPLTATLRILERNGLVERIVYPVVPPKVEYGLTNLGIELLAVTDALNVWSEIHYQEMELARIDYDTRDGQDGRPFWMAPKSPNAGA